MHICIGEKIKEYRKIHSITQEDFAMEIRVSRQCVCKWEKGICFPDIMLLPKIAQLLQCKIDDFFTPCSEENEEP